MWNGDFPPEERTKSSGGDSALDSSSVYSNNLINPIGKEKEKRTLLKWFRKRPKDNETSTSEGIFRKNSDAETYTHSHPNLIITPYEKDEFAPITLKSEKSDQLFRLEKENSRRRKETTQNEFNLDIDDMDGIIRNDNREHRSGASNIQFKTWIRIFRPDATFACVCCYLNITTAELCYMLGKKFFIQDISKYFLYIKRHNLERMLSPNERPLKLQKQLLEQAGYTENDKLDGPGREDNSYLFRFTFRETTMPRFEEEQGALSSIQHVDLQARNLQTIPIFLYRQAYFIRSLNVSQNLMLDLPTDFIQSCHQLKELYLSQNELERVPQSVKQSQMLSALDLSSNRLQELDHAQLEQSELTNLQVDNNSLSSLPKSFAKFRCLNILNVANNSFTKFPPVICDIISLSELDMSFNKITSVPMEIGNLVHLKRLFLIGNQITGSLPTSFSNLTSLQKLDIRRNQLTNIDVLSLVPNLQILLIESNNVSIVRLSSSSLQKLILPKNMLTQFSLMGIGTSITDLSLAYSKLIELPDRLFEDLVSLEKVDLSNNQLTKIPNSIGSLKKLAHFSCTNNTLSALPSEIASLTALRVLDIHNNNLSSLPPEIWYCAGLVTLNASSNLLEQFPMRPTPFSDVNQSNSVRPNSCLSNALRALYLGDNSLTTEIFSAISLFNELRILNLSFNLLDEIPTGGIVNPHLTELYLSGNEISSLPDDIEKLTSLRVLHINGNKLQTLPAELGKIRKLVVLDVGNNGLKYNIANWQFEWNWNWNIELKYLNLSGNKRLKIKHALFNELNPPRDRNLADFGALTQLRVLGLMDIALLDLIVPDETDNRRVRTSRSEVNYISYGMADTLGTSDNLSTWEAVIPKFRGREDEYLFGLFEGRAGTNRGGRVTKYLHDYFQLFFKTELEKLKDFDTVESALRRSFLSLNKELGRKVFTNNIALESEYAWKSDDNKSGASGVVVYISGTILYVANVGDTRAVIGRNNGNAYEVACNQSIISSNEIARIREAGGFISHDCLVNGEVNVSRSFGHFHLTPIINANPSIEKINLSEQDEFIILATCGLWDRMSYQTAVDVTRTEIGDLMRAAQKLRDFAISYGAEENIMVIIIGVGDLFDRRPRRRSDGLEGMAGEKTFYFGSKTKRGRREENPSDSTMLRLQKEIPPPTGQVALVFTDIKNSIFLWDSIPNAMRSATKQHNTIMRRQLRNIGGYEVRMDGDAFMVSFPAVSSALLWCFTVQLELLTADWPEEIIDSEDGKLVYGGTDNDLIYKGLSVKMGIHWGMPVCEPDIITKRMNYFGPMVNRAAMIRNNADGGQICISSDVEAEIRLLHGMIDNDFLKKTNDEEAQGTLLQSNNGVLDKNLIRLRKLGFVMRKIGERKLKGLENPEVLYLVYPDALRGRLEEDLANNAKEHNQTRLESFNKTNNKDEEWIKKKMKEEDINYFEYSEFIKIEKIGEGGFGIITKAETNDKKQVALKSFINSVIDKNVIKNFVNELQLLRMVSYHDNINRFLGITKDNVGYVMVLEFANEGNLRDYLKKKFDLLQWENKIQMALDITCGIRCLHSKNILHRDLHSKNVLVNNGKLLIADFGLSKQLTEVTSNSMSNRMGIIEYIEPQCLRNINYVKDKRSDVYSLGVLLWEITSRRPPFHNIEERDMLGYHISRENLREEPIEGTPLEYQELYQKCWDGDPEERPDVNRVYNEISRQSKVNDTQEEHEDSPSGNSRDDLNIHSGQSDLCISDKVVDSQKQVSNIN